MTRAILQAQTEISSAFSAVHLTCCVPPQINFPQGLHIVLRETTAKIFSKPVEQDIMFDRKDLKFMFCSFHA